MSNLNENELQSLEDDIIGNDEGDSDDEYDYNEKRGGEGKNEEDDKEPEYMQFDFRRGSWPQFAELIDTKTAEEEVEDTVKQLEEIAKLKKNDNDSKSATSKEFGKSAASYSTNVNGRQSKTQKDALDEKSHLLENRSVELAVFEPVKSGCPTSLIIQPGYRLKLKLNNLLDGGDKKNKKRAQRLSKSKRKQHKQSSASNATDGGVLSGVSTEAGDDLEDYDMWAYDDSYPEEGYNSFYRKQYVNQYTITMDLKLLQNPPREGLSLFQTALIHSEENKKTGKVTLTRSDGECVVSQAGGVGMFGTYGDISKAKLELNRWKRVVIAVNCSQNANTKGEMRTWIGTESAAVVREDSIVANERFALDSSALYLFSSGQSAMMPGGVAVRYVRVDRSFASDADVKANRARDKVQFISPSDFIQFQYALQSSSRCRSSACLTRTDGWRRKSRGRDSRWLRSFPSPDLCGAPQRLSVPSATLSLRRRILKGRVSWRGPTQ